MLICNLLTGEVLLIDKKEMELELTPFLDARYVNITGDTMTGGLTIQPATDTLTAFVVNDQDANNVLTVDTINNSVGIGADTDAYRRLILSKTFTNTVDVSGAINTFAVHAYFGPTSDSAANVSGAKMYARPTGSSNLTGNVRGMFGQVQNQNTATATAIQGMSFFVSNDSTGNVTGMIGSNVNVTNSSTGIITNGTGFSSYVSNTSTGTITNAYGYTTGVNNTTTGIVTTWKGYTINAPTNPGGGTITTTYGFSMAADTGAWGTSKYGLYLNNISGASANNYAIVTNAGSIVFNEGGDSATDVRMEGDTKANLFFLDASVDMIGIGNNATPVDLLDINNTTGGSMTLRRVDTSVTADDLIGQIMFYAADTSTTTNFTPAAIRAYASNTITTDINPGYLTFWTTPTGVAGVLTERIRINSAGNVGIGTTGPLAKLHVDQSSTTGAVPVLTVDQADISEEFVRFIGTSANAVLNQSIVEAADVTTATIAGYLKIYVQDDGNQLTDQSYYLPIYTLV